MSTFVDRYPSKLRLGVAVAWTVLCVYLAIAIASRITGDGLLNLHSSFATRVPMNWLFALLGFRHMNLGTVVGMILVCLAAYCLDRLLHDLLVIEETGHPAIRTEAHKLFFRTFGLGLIVLDATFFALGLSRPSGWDTPNATFSVAVLTALYVCLMAGMTYLNILLWLNAEGD